MHSFMDAKLMAKLLRQGLSERNIDLSHSECLELVSRQFGVANWNILSARIDAASTQSPPLVMPDGWIDASPSSEGYFRMGLDPERPGCALIESTPLANHQPRGQFATMAQIIAADEYRGAAIRIACELSCRDLDGAATLWVRLDDAGGRRLRFENLLDRPGVAVSGTENWKGFAVTLDVPEKAENVHFGFLVSGRGKGWARDFSVARVEADDTVRRQRNRFNEPTNLSFSA